MLCSELSLSVQQIMGGKSIEKMAISWNGKTNSIEWTKLFNKNMATDSIFLFQCNCCRYWTVCQITFSTCLHIFLIHVCIVYTYCCPVYPNWHITIFCHLVHNNGKWSRTNEVNTNPFTWQYSQQQWFTKQRHYTAITSATRVGRSRIKPDRLDSECLK